MLIYSYLQTYISDVVENALLTWLKLTCPNQHLQIYTLLGVSSLTSASLLKLLLGNKVSRVPRKHCHLGMEIRCLVLR